MADTHEASVDKALRDRTGLSTSDVDYKTYDRIGGGSGKSDSYAEGVTSSRQAGQGSAEKYTVNADGTARDPVKVSGQTVVDQNQLNKAKYDLLHKFPEDPTRIPQREIPSVLEQQTDALGRHPDDPLTVAKAVGRTEKMANVVGESLGDQRLTKAAKEDLRQRRRARQPRHHGPGAQEIRLRRRSRQPRPVRLLQPGRFHRGRLLGPLPPAIRGALNAHGPR